MSATLQEREAARSAPRRGPPAVALMLLAAVLLFLHGCHGEDVDTELLAPLVEWM